MCIAEEDWGSVYVFAILQSSPRQTESQGKDKILSGGVTPFLTLYLTLPPERSGIHPKICLEETWECFIQFGAFRNYYSTYKIIISFLRIFNNSTVGAQKPKWISPRSQLAICSGLVSIQVSEEWVRPFKLWAAAVQSHSGATVGITDISSYPCREREISSYIWERKKSPHIHERERNLLISMREMRNLYNET